MARKTILTRGEIALVRELAAGVIVADNVSLTDATNPPAKAIDCTGLDTIFVGVEIDAGTAPTMTIEALFRDPTAADGLRWKRLLVGARPGVTLGAAANEDTGALASNVNMVELRVYGHSKVFLRVKAVANATSTTGARILAMPGAKRSSV